MLSILPELTLDTLKAEARTFIQTLSVTPIPSLYSATDGKAVGTYVEQTFRHYLSQSYSFQLGNSAQGIDFPSLQLDLKVTSINQPQSSCPFKDASQKVYGLGYHLLVLVYEKSNNDLTKTTTLNFKNAVFIDREQTADYQTTRGLIDILERDANEEDVKSFLQERMLPLDEIGLEALSKRIFQERPRLGYLTITQALQWRLQYKRAIDVALLGKAGGIENILA